VATLSIIIYGEGVKGFVLHTCLLVIVISFDIYSLTSLT
jgi:hypothetical protein